MPARLLGRKVTSLTEDKDGHRDYKVSFKVELDDPETESVINVYNCPDIPQPGNYYEINRELDLWAWCGREINITELIDSEPNIHFLVERTFSTRNTTRCVDTKIENPLFEPPKISWSYSKTKEEATQDLFGQPIQNSAFEMIKGPQVEFETGNVSVRIEQNVATFYQACVLPAALKDCVNVSPLWGFPPRTVRLAGVTGEKKYYGQCFAYYTRHLEFETEYLVRTGPNGQTIVSNWDRYLLDEGHKVLSGTWKNVAAPGTGIFWKLNPINGEQPDHTNPAHFIQYRDASGQNVKVVLNGAGVPVGSSVGDQDRYIAIKPIAEGENIPLTDDTAWIKQSGGDQPFEADTGYLKGAAVFFEDDENIYIATSSPVGFPVPPEFPPWFFLFNGITDVGFWQIGTKYRIGDRVRNPNFSQKTAPGQIFVAKYPYANFSVLGIPLVI